MSVLTRAVAATAAAGAVSGVGALVLALVGEISSRTYSTILGFSAGVMLGISSLVLLPQSVTEGGVFVAVMGLLLGGAFVTFLEYILPHLHPHFGSDTFAPGMEHALLLAVAIAIHNVPEGLAMGLGYVAGVHTTGPQLALAMACQNIPEGLAISLPLRRSGVNRWITVIFATLAGISGVLGAWIAVIGAKTVRSLLPLGLSFAAGALIYVTADQLIPEAHEPGGSTLPSWGVTMGFILVLLVGWWVGL